MNKKNFTIFIVLICLIIVTAVVVALTSKPTTNQLNQNLATNQDATETKEPEIRHLYIGYIEEIKPGKIIIKATKQNNDLPEDVIVAVVIDENTELTKVSIPKTITPEMEKSNKIFGQEEISVDELKVGDQITVINNLIDLTGLDEFIAEKINLNVVK